MKAKKMTISQAARKLMEMGYTLGGAVAWVPGEKETSYSVTNPDGNKSVMTAKQIINLVSGN